MAKRARRQTKVSATGPVIASIGNPGQPIWTPRDLDKLAREAYVCNVVAYRCTNIIAEGFASVAWCLFEGKDEVDAHPLLALLTKPNPMQGGADLFYAFAASRLIAGNAYMEEVGPDSGPPSELYALNPNYMRVVPSPSGPPQGYEFGIGQRKVFYPLDPLTGESRIWQWKTFHPLNHYYGMSPIEAAAYSIDQHNMAGAHNMSLLQKGGRPSGMVTYNPPPGVTVGLTDEQEMKLRAQLQNEIEGAHNAGRILLGVNGLDWKEMGISPKDMDFLNTKLQSARDICAGYGVPPMLVGVQGDATYANYKEARMALWEDTILPLVDKCVDGLNNWLVPKFGTNLRLSYDDDSISALAPRRAEKWDRVAKADFLTINEKREALGYDKRSEPEADQLMQPFSLVPLGADESAVNPVKASQLAYGKAK